MHFGRVHGLPDRVDGENIDIVWLIDGLVVYDQFRDCRFERHFLEVRLGDRQVMAPPFDEIPETGGIVLLLRDELQTDRKIVIKICLCGE